MTEAPRRPTGEAHGAPNRRQGATQTPSATVFWPSLTSGEWRDPEGVVRLRARQITWEGCVRLAFEELTLAGAGSPQVARRLFAALDDLLAIAPAKRWPLLERQRELLAAAVEDAYGDRRTAESAQVPDVQGIGSGADVAAAPGAVEGTSTTRPTPRAPQKVREGVDSTPKHRLPKSR